MPFNTTRGVASAKAFGLTAGNAPALYPFTSATFTNAFAEGTLGPTLAQCTSAYSGQEFLNGYFAVNPQGYQIWTVPQTRSYRITAAGAQGGAGKWNVYYGGFGAILSATFSLAVGEQLIFVVGQRGGYVQNSSQGSGGGGGGSFVFLNTVSSGSLLLAAGGGGGGGGNSAPTNGVSGATTTAGAQASPVGGAPGTNGNGGTALSGGGAGGGLLSAGGGTSVGGAAGGAAILLGGAGGRGGTCTASQTGSFNYNGLGQDQGGFGGGGGGEWCSAGSVGAGGGYSGGGGNSSNSGVGGGGGSFFSVSAQNPGTSDGLYEGSSTGITNLNQFNGSTTAAFRAALHGYISVEAV